MKQVAVWVKRGLKLALLLGAASLLFLLFLELFYPIKLDKVKERSRVVLAEDGSWLFATLNKEEKWRFRVESSKLDPLYLRMLLNFEDRRFYKHFGVDPLALVRASWQLLMNGHITSGGSTITMQLARLLEPKRRTVAAKIFEIFRAIQLELHYSKKEILESYLTLTPYGGNIEGVIAASMHYFGKLPSALSASEAAILVALPQSPEHNRPDRHPKWAKEARNKVLKRSFDAAILADRVYQEALLDRVKKESFPFPRYAPHLSLKLLATKKESLIKTTIHLPLQVALEKWAKLEANILPKDATLAALVIRNRDGAVVGYLGSYDIFNRSNAGYIDMLQALRSPGSILKPFIYGLAFQKRIIDTNTIINDKEIQIANYRPHNYSKEFYGEVTVAKALQNSLNIPAVKVLQEVGVNQFIQTLQESVGKITIPQSQATLPVALGGFGITPMQVAGLYTLLANGGSGYKLHTLKSEHLEKKELLSPEAARKVTNILRQMQPPQGYTNRFYKVAYKTGTSYGFRDFWTVAYTKEYTILVWVGKANNRPLFRAAAREVAAPLAFSLHQIVENIFPQQSWSFAPNRTTTIAPPPLLQYFDKRSKVSSQKFDFIYPKEGTRYQSATCEDVAVDIAIQGGLKPYAWYLNSTPLQVNQPKTTLHLSPGAHTLTIIDNSGTLISRNLWVNAPECN